MHGLPKFLLPCPGDTYLLKWMMAQMDTRCMIGVSQDTHQFVQAYKRDTDKIYPAYASQSMAQTVKLAPSFFGAIADKSTDILLGMPDTYWTDTLVFKALAARLKKFVCAVALFQVTLDQTSRLGMCAWEHGVLTEVEDKPSGYTAKTRAWGAIAWQPEFWPYIHQEDAHMGIALQRAIDDDQKIGVFLADGPYYDCGFPTEYFRLIKEQT